MRELTWAHWLSILFLSVGVTALIELWHARGRMACRWRGHPPIRPWADYYLWMTCWRCRRPVVLPPWRPVRPGLVADGSMHWIKFLHNPAWPANQAFRPFSPRRRAYASMRRL